MFPLLPVCIVGIVVSTTIVGEEVGVGGTEGVLRSAMASQAEFFLRSRSRTVHKTELIVTIKHMMIINSMAKQLSLNRP